MPRHNTTTQNTQQTQNASNNSAFNTLNNSAFNTQNENTFNTQNTGGFNQTNNQTSNQGFNNQNTYDFLTAPDTEDIKALRGWRPQIDPGIASQAGNARNKLRSSFINPLGGYATPAMQEAIQRAGERNINQDESQAYRGAFYDANQQRAGQLGTLANLTAPHLVGTGTTGTSTGTTTGNQVGTSTGTSSGTSGGTSSGTTLSGSAGTSEGTSAGSATGSGTTVQQVDLLGQIIGAGAQIGGAALM